MLGGVFKLAGLSVMSEAVGDRKAGTDDQDRAGDGIHVSERVNSPLPPGKALARATHKTAHHSPVGCFALARALRAFGIVMGPMMEAGGRRLSKTARTDRRFLETLDEARGWTGWCVQLFKWPLSSRSSRALPGETPDASHL